MSKQGRHVLEWTGIIIILLIASIGILVSQHNTIWTTYHQEVSATRINKHQQKLDDQKHTRIDKQFELQAPRSKDPVVRNIAINNQTMDSMYPVYNKFFTVMYDYHSSNQQYLARPKKLVNVATPNVLHNQSIFDKDSGGGVGALQISSSFTSVDIFITNQKGHNYGVLANGQFASNDNEPNGTQHGSEWYYTTYNSLSHKITSIQKIYKINNVKNLSN